MRENTMIPQLMIFSVGDKIYRIEAADGRVAIDEIGPDGPIRIAEAKDMIVAFDLVEEHATKKGG